MVEIIDDNEIHFWNNPDETITIKKGETSLLTIDVKELLFLEKKKLKIPTNQLVFVGMKNLADYYWCAWQYYKKSLEMEISFFWNCVMYNFFYSKEFGLLPQKWTKESFLSMGEKITYAHVQKSLKKIIPDIQGTEQKKQRAAYIEHVTEMINNESDPIRKGNFYHQIKKEEYPTCFWHFRYKNLIIVGIADGITDKFVYEFKSTKHDGWLQSIKNSASMQADIYGYFFKRDTKRIQIYCHTNDKTYTYVEPVNTKKVIDLLEKWISMINGEIPLKPKPYKCNNCEYKDNCELHKPEN